MTHETQAPQGFVLTLLSRLQAITPDQYRSPPTRDEIPKDWKERGEANTFAKQAYTLGMIIEEEIKPVIAEFESLLLEESQNQRNMAHGGYRPNQTRKDRIRYLDDVIEEQGRCMGLVADMMMTELCKQFSDRASHLSIVGPWFRVYSHPCEDHSGIAVIRLQFGKERHSLH